MICSLRGKVIVGELPFITIDVQGVGYAVQASSRLLESIQMDEEMFVHIYTYVREDRLELFGFSSDLERRLFAQFLGVSGVGPRIALQLCAVPVDLLHHAVQSEDVSVLSSLKGVGKKMAEKLLLELQSFEEKGLLVPSGTAVAEAVGSFDDDALQALTQLGLDRRTVIAKLREAPEDIVSTEDRVRYVLTLNT